MLINNYRLLNLTNHIINTGAAFSMTFYAEGKIRTQHEVLMWVFWLFPVLFW